MISLVLTFVGALLVFYSIWDGIDRLGREVQYLRWEVEDIRFEIAQLASQLDKVGERRE